jgi:hypothetical protein
MLNRARQNLDILDFVSKKMKKNEKKKSTQSEKPQFPTTTFLKINFKIKCRGVAVLTQCGTQEPKHDN